MSAEICQEGLEYILEVAFPESQSVPANFYIGLCEDATVAENAVLADLTELAGNGYARQLVPSQSHIGFLSAHTGTNDHKVTTTIETFLAAGGAWNGAVHAFLATSSDDSGKLIAAVALSAERTLQDGDSLQVSIVLQLNG